MSEETFSIDKLRVAAPCRESWDEMAGTDEVRFCSHCRKGVHDVSQLTRTQAERLVARSRGGVCVRFVRHADGSVVVREKPPAFGRVRRRLSFVASGVLAALLGLFTDARAQAPSTYKSKSCPDARINVTRTRRAGVSAQVERGTLAGTITDPNGAVIPGVRVSLKRQVTQQQSRGDEQKNAQGERRDAGGGTEVKGVQPAAVVSSPAVVNGPVVASGPAGLSGPVVATSDEGGFKFASVERGVYTLTVEAVGFQKVEVENISVGDGEDVRFDVSLPVTGTVTVGFIILPYKFTPPNNNLAMPIDKAPLFGIGGPDE
ncbi:MAG: hypothetical protein QOJ76_2134 [Acidobacteriota bacterium]|nr:hypothetical protein [Acidobacteriota bacterium]